MSTIEKIRESKLQPKWTTWISIATVVVCLISLILNVTSGKSELAALTSCCVSLAALCAYGASQARINKKLVEEIDRLRSSQNPNS